MEGGTGLTLHEYGMRRTAGLLRRFRPVALVRDAPYQIVLCADDSYICFAGDGFGSAELERAGFPSEVRPEMVLLCEERVWDIGAVFWHVVPPGTYMLQVYRNSEGKYWTKMCASPVAITKDQDGWWEVYTMPSLYFPRILSSKCGVQRGSQGRSSTKWCQGSKGHSSSRSGPGST